MCACVCVRACVYVLACVRVCMHARYTVRACVHARATVQLRNEITSVHNWSAKCDFWMTTTAPVVLLSSLYDSSRVAAWYVFNRRTSQSFA